ncbi:MULTISPECIES: hypothetical protein [Caballeronia]|nr:MULTISPECIES: hypothetical protein [Caballeronia]
MKIEVVRRMNLARHHLELANVSLRSANDLHLFSAVNLLQDAVEAFLLAIADHVDAPLDKNTPFDKYFVLIDQKLASPLPFKIRLMQLNQLRVNSKHHGLQPARDECNRLTLTVQEFFDSVCGTVLGASFSTISAIDLLLDGEAKDALIAARDARAQGDLRECAIQCRQALYVEIEGHYSVEAFKSGQMVGLLSGGWTDAPQYARNKAYIDKYVNDPTDYTVYIRSEIDQKLLKYGADPTTFWNVHALTPEVYRTKDESRWIVKNDFAKLDAAVLADNIEYIFSSTLDIILSIHRTRQQIKQLQPGKFVVELTQDCVPIYEKADVNSKHVFDTPRGETHVEADFQVEGLNGDGDYIHVSFFGDKQIVYGYIEARFAV